MSRILRSLLVASAACLLSISAAWAWAPLGHSLVGELAQRQLDPKAQAEVDKLLAGEPNPTLAGIANWADQLRYTDNPRFKATSPWHYINAKTGGCAFDLARDCPDGNCAVGALQKQLVILGDRSQPLSARREALKFVVHLVGDIHQPMHAGSRRDYGGNRFQISLTTNIPPEAYARKRYKDGVMGTNLHSVWDYYILESRGLEVQAYADQLSGKGQGNLPAPIDVASAPLAWAEASCKLTETGGIYPPDTQHKLDHTYLGKFRPMAEARVQLAAERLAQLLNQTLGS